MKEKRSYLYSGIAHDGGTYTSNNPNALAGTQVAFVKNNGLLNQIWSASAGTYTLSFEAAQRGSGNDSAQQLRVTLRPSGSAMSTKTFLWCGNQICEERDSAGTTVIKRFFAEGEQRVSGSVANFYYSRDHLGSIREVTDSNGVVRGRYDYDAWGNPIAFEGKVTADFGYTGHYFHQPSGLNLAMYRAYSPALGRWISRDPMGEQTFGVMPLANGYRGSKGLVKGRPGEMIVGANLYEYVDNDPINLIDPIGLSPHAVGCLREYSVCVDDCGGDCPINQGQTNPQYNVCIRWCDVMYKLCLAGERPIRIPPQLNPPTGDPWATPGFDPWRPFGPGSMKPTHP